MPGRNANPGSYRHGFNGMEKDDELKGNGNSYDFGARIYDSRLGRFLSIDPLSNKYPHNTPYSLAFNNPILMVDIFGLEGVIYIQVMLDEGGEPLIDKQTMAAIENDIRNRYQSMGVELDVKVTYGNDIMPKADFYGRKDASKLDTYSIIGTPEQLIAIDTDESLGWEYLSVDNVSPLNNPMGYSDAQRIDGRSAKDDYFNLINTYQLLNKRDDFPTGVEKASVTIQHEAGHPKFGPGMDDYYDGHIQGTIMQAAPDSENNVYNEQMIIRLKMLHNEKGPNLQVKERKPLGPTKFE